MKNNISKKGLIIWLITCLFFLYEFFLRTFLGTFQKNLSIELDLSSFQFSFLSTTIFFFIYSIMQIPVSLIFNRSGLKKSLIIGVSICIVSCIGFGLSYNYAMCLLFRILMGMGCSFGFLGILLSIYDWLPKTYTAFFIGISQFIGTLGAMISAGPLESIIINYNLSWNKVCFGLTIIGLFILVLVIFFVENKKSIVEKYIVLRRPEMKKKTIIKKFIKSQVWLIAFFSAVTYFTLEYLTENGGRLFLEKKNISPKISSYMLTTSWLSYGIFNPLICFISDFFKKRKLIVVLTNISVVISLFILLFLRSKILLFLSFILLGIGATGQSLGFSLMSENIESKFLSIGLGLNNTIITFFPAFLAPILGLGLDALKSNNINSINDYIYVYSIILIFSIISLILSIIFIKETYCKSRVEFTFLKR